ncbi:MAG: deoxyguanosinetriphosphate triphosphohydrolase [Anaerolineales bacterium]|jgi:dGTPase
MIRSREELEQFEDQQLAPYGFRSSNSRGRAYPDKEPSYRTVFQRDRDRIVHTTAFRRLEYKTQVFVITEGDYYRTRLTHTLEVAQIGRTLARALGANEDLVEAICLAHDLGHTPFGHAGERALSMLMEDHGAFNHNTQSLRIVTELEQRYPEFPGLNLTWEVREGIVKHETEYDISEAEGFEPDKRGHLEAQIANAADETAYTAHDLDDGLRAGLLVPEAMSKLKLWQQVTESIGWKSGELGELDRHRLIRRLIGILIGEILEYTQNKLELYKIHSVEDVQNHSANLVGLSDEMHTKNQELKTFLYDHMYRHHRVYRMQVKAEKILAELFEAYTQHPAMLPEEIQVKASEEHFYRAIADYIAGMTDRFALDEHSRLFDPQVNL